MATKLRALAMGKVEPAGVAARTGIPPIGDGGSQPQKIDTYLDGVPEFTPWIVDNIVYRGGVTLLSATPKTGKSTFTMQMVRAMENPAGGFIDHAVPNGGPVLLITEEGGVSIRWKSPGIYKMYVYDRKMAAGESFEATLSKASAWVEAQRNPNCIVIIDTFAAWAQVEEENSATAVTEKMQKVLYLAESKSCGVLLIHHMRKSGGSNGSGIRGSGAMYGSVDHSLEMERVTDKADDPRRKISVTSRVAKADTWHLTFNDIEKTYMIDPEGGEGESQEKITLADVARIEDIPSGGTGLTMAEAIDNWNTSDSTARRWMQKYINNGYVQEDPGAGRIPTKYYRIKAE